MDGELYSGSVVVVCVTSLTYLLDWLPALWDTRLEHEYDYGGGAANSTFFSGKGMYNLQQPTPDGNN